MPLNSDLTREQSNALYDEVLDAGDPDCLRRLCLEDLFFLLTRTCKRFDIDRDFLYLRVREVEAAPDGFLDLWFREAYKSTIITFGLNIQDILNDPEDTCGIFSHTRPIAKSFLVQIKRELENNTFLKNLFPDILYYDPAKESPMWSLDGGIVVKRKSNPKEATVEAYGLVDGQPTSKHFGKLCFDDVVTKESVSSPEMIDKTTDGWALSLNLGADRMLPDGSIKPCRKRYTGTRYHLNDTYKVIIERGAVRVREYYPTDLGKKDIDVRGKPVLFSEDYLREKRINMGIYIYGCQMLQDPRADIDAGFLLDWIEHYNFLKKFETWNKYIIVDPASKKKKDSDYTVMAVVGMAEDNNYYLLDGIRDRMNLTERTTKLFELHRKWQPKNTGYEEYGMQCDREHIEYVQEQEGYRFHIEPLGGNMVKEDRIRRLVPIFEQHRFFMPHKLLFVTHDGKAADFIKMLVDEEYTTFPMGSHDDGMDCIARITDETLGAVFPKITLPKTAIYVPDEKYDPMAIPK